MLVASLFLGNLGPGELVLVGLVVLLLFGGKKIPELMKGLGQGVKEFNKAKNSIENEVKENIREIESNK
jgi:sec-independent protein translocase protein TatA